ncbi:reverse transcriptase family protein [Burkholderia ubonensis]|uniref:reverse transcriptase family protein n=1 Tax=Burkholderia ubonensis TaxID=101571 RepID=UPI0009B351E7|nr:reverse transcriptase family protein [Burkholderia ubonensis]
MAHTPRFHPVKESAGSIADVASLCVALDVALSELSSARNLPADQRYFRREVRKKDGSIRVVYNPHYLIRKIQRRINRRIFSNSSVVSWPDHIFGSIPNDDFSESDASEKDYVNCARQHCGAKSVLSLDIRDFFDNIHREIVRGIFSRFFNYPDDVSDALADVCCMGDHVVQGALTSSYIATLCLWDVEGQVVRKLGYKGLVYTRFVDDINISSKVARYDFSYALRLVEEMVSEAGLPLNGKKTKIQYASIKPLIVHGLRVDFDQPRLPPEEPRNIRAAVKNLELLAASPGYRASRSYRKDFNRCLGRVNKLARVGHQLHEFLMQRLRKILPLPSNMDIERAEKMISRLERDAVKSGYTETYWFKKRYFAASERIGILKRSFPNKAKELREKLKNIGPSTYRE